MGPGVPYGIGAKFGHPDRPVIVFAGDGPMQMNGLAELGDPDRWGVLKEGLMTKAREILPSRSE